MPVLVSLWLFLSLNVALAAPEPGDDASPGAVAEGAADQEDPTNPATILPSVSGDFSNIAQCERLMVDVNINILKARETIASRGSDFQCISCQPSRSASANDILGCAIKTGDIKLWMVPFYVRRVLEFIIALAGILTVGGILYGGYMYLFAGLSDDKDKGKNAIKNGVIGLVLTLTAWAIVNIVVALVSG